MAGDERVSVEIKLYDGDAEVQSYAYSNVGTSWLSVETVRRNAAGDDAEYLKDDAYPSLADSGAKYVLIFKKKREEKTSNLALILFGVAFVVTLLLCLTLMFNPIWLLGFSARYFLYIWIFGMLFTLPFWAKPEPNPVELVWFGIGAALFLFAPIAFYSIVLAEFGGINLMNGTLNVMPSLHDIGESLVNKASRVTELPTVLAAWLPIVTAAFLALGRSNLAKAAGALKKAS